MEIRRHPFFDVRLHHWRGKRFEGIGQQLVSARVKASHSDTNQRDASKWRGARDGKANRLTAPKLVKHPARDRHYNQSDPQRITCMQVRPQQHQRR